MPPLRIGPPGAESAQTAPLGGRTPRRSTRVGREQEARASLLGFSARRWEEKKHDVMCRPSDGFLLFFSLAANQKDEMSLHRDRPLEAVFAIIRK